MWKSLRRLQFGEVSIVIHDGSLHLAYEVLGVVEPREIEGEREY